MKTNIVTDFSKSPVAGSGGQLQSSSLENNLTRRKTELIISFITQDYQQHMNIVSAIVLDHPNELTMGKRDWATLSKLRKS